MHIIRADEKEKEDVENTIHRIIVQITKNDTPGNGVWLRQAQYQRITKLLCDC